MEEGASRGADSSSYVVDRRTKLNNSSCRSRKQSKMDHMPPYTAREHLPLIHLTLRRTDPFTFPSTSYTL